MPVSSVRYSPENDNVIQHLGMLREFAGPWEGRGFNLIARPDFEGHANLYLQLNQTQETFDVTPIGSAVPNRACGCDDIDLYGLTYLHKVKDRSTGSALHIEPGMWMIQPPTDYPSVHAPAGGQIVYRMASIPHGNTLLAQGAAANFSGTPIVANSVAPYALSDFLSFNSTPITGATPPEVAIMNVAGSSEAGTTRSDHLVPFDQYNLSIPESAENPRTPYATRPPEPPLPREIDGVPMQQLVNDPITLLQAEVQRQVDAGYSFEGVAINVLTQQQVGFRKHVNDPYGPYDTVSPSNAAGGLTNTPFLAGGDPVGHMGPNAAAALVYATYWISRLTHPDDNRPPIMQLQYAQMTVLNFEILNMPDQGIIGWPHVSVATLRKSFGCARLRRGNLLAALAVEAVDRSPRPHRKC
ncbi:heme-binding protein [Flexivirga meconopsidis]|uniref:heme-binding protein n=1 Tax=Flexivirga meconopsidis TaxID=2977121 RepID=UPI00223FFDA7|nr:heme-binding protein [Flexivirga meconopsidis]